MEGLYYMKEQQFAPHPIPTVSILPPPSMYHAISKTNSEILAYQAKKQIVFTIL